MNVENILLLFNEYIDRVKNNIADCKILSLSLKVSECEFAYASVDKQNLGEKDIIMDSISCAIKDSNRELHREIYSKVKGAKSIINADAPNAAAVAKTGKHIPALIDNLAQIIGVDAKCSKNDKKAIIKNLKKRKGTLVKERGIITYGRTLDEAYAGCLVLEKGAKCYIDATILGNYRKIPYIEAKLMHLIYQKKYSTANQQRLMDKQKHYEQEAKTKKYDYESKEWSIRQGIVEAGQRLLQNNLVQGTWGNISVRLNDTHILITPSGLDYMSLTPEDIVLLDLATMEYSGTLKPSGEKGIHAALLRDRADINVVMHSHPSECSAFAAASYELPAINEDMEKYVKGSARVAAYALPSTKALAKATVKAMQGRNACFMANHGMLAVGGDISETFECCRVLEESAKTYIDDLAAKAMPESEYGNRISLFLQNAQISK